MEGVLKEPLLYLSLYLKTNRDEYYAHLQNVRETGDWESWIEFFLKGIIETATQATETAQAVLLLFNKDRKKIEDSDKANATVLMVHTYLQKHPITNTRHVKEECKVALPTVLRALSVLEDMGIIKETTGKERHKVFAYTKYLDLLSDGTPPSHRK